ncbi:MAG: Cytosolic iron-sulfur protein assembly protein [Bogoriella megaspora]|nr:MAG: Cytosolic iron-sulfur protein assembly protein [Bogoriella megaspora]
MATTPTPHSLIPLATLTPPSSTRTWFSTPHPTLPLVATASSDKTVRVYSLNSFRLHSTVTGGHKRSIRACAWKPGAEKASNGSGESVLATGSFDASAGIWRRRIRGLGDDVEEQRLRDADEDEDDEGDEDDDWRFSVVLDGHDSEIKSLAWSPGGNLLATCSRDKSVWIWEELPDEEDNFETVAVLQEHEGDVKCVAWHPEEELLASASYDDTIRLYKEDADDWTCVSVLDAHEATVWCVDFEAPDVLGLGKQGEDLDDSQKRWLERRRDAGPRIVSCSDDLTIRIWRRAPRERQEHHAGKSSVPSILKSRSIEETWVEEARLPQHHNRAVYTVNWSKVTGRIVSTGSDGKIIVFQERWKVNEGTSVNGHSAAAANGHSSAMDVDVQSSSEELSFTEWVVAAELEEAHDVYEINHVCWSRRWDKGKRSDDEEILISTGDDGEVKAWSII